MFRLLLIDFNLAEFIFGIAALNDFNDIGTDGYLLLDTFIINLRSLDSGDLDFMVWHIAGA